MTRQPSAALAGTFQYLIYSPRGKHEGALLDCDGAPVQLVFERHDAKAGAAFGQVARGQTVAVDALSQGPSTRGEAEHPVYAFGRLRAIDGQKPVKPKVAAPGPASRGRVVRLNCARHGAANGVVLDTGDFIHTQPDGMARLKLKDGATVTADGDAQRLADDSGWAIEASRVNRKAMGPR